MLAVRYDPVTITIGQYCKAVLRVIYHGRAFAARDQAEERELPLW